MIKLFISPEEKVTVSFCFQAFTFFWYFPPEATWVSRSSNINKQLITTDSQSKGNANDNFIMIA
jgi:hypothetical protein